MSISPFNWWFILWALTAAENLLIRKGHPVAAGGMSLVLLVLSIYMMILAFRGHK